MACLNNAVIFNTDKSLRNGNPKTEKINIYALKKQTSLPSWQCPKPHHETGRGSWLVHKGCTHTASDSL